jgi:hypothetical protein
MDSKYETSYLDGNLSKKLVVSKKMALKTNFECESYSIFKKDINGNQSAMWKVEVAPCGDGSTMRWLSKNKSPPGTTLAISSLL